MKLPNSVKLVEVGPRDGLQNETHSIPVDVRVNFIDKLSAAGLPVIEVGSFVSPKWVPQMADTDKVFKGITPSPQTHYPALVPNEKGFEAALTANVKSIAIFTAASETFSQKNTNCSIAESIERFKPVLEKAKQNKIETRAYISCAIACPYEGEIAPDKVAKLAKQLEKMGCYEISLGDTIGKGTPRQTRALIEAVKAEVPVDKIAVHFHDTYGQALANIMTALEMGVATVDSAVSGLGGCPYAAGATGNVASEDVLYLLNGLNIKTGVDLHKLIEAGYYIDEYLKRNTQSRVTKALS